MRKYLQIIQLIEDLHPEYTKKSESHNKKTNNPVKKQAKHLNRHFTEKLKTKSSDADQHHEALGKCKIKPQ